MVSPAVVDFPWEHQRDAGDPGDGSGEGYSYVPEVFAFTPVTMRKPGPVSDPGDAREEAQAIPAPAPAAETVPDPGTSPGQQGGDQEGRHRRGTHPSDDDGTPVHPHEDPGGRTPEQPGRADANVAGAAPRPEPNRPPGHDTHEGHDMTLDNKITQLLAIEGASGAAIVDGASGMALAQGGHPGFDLSVAAAGNSNVVRSKIKTMTDLGLDSRIEDILITLDGQYHLINVLSGRGADGLFVYLVLDRTSGNLALARHKLTNIAKDIAV
jgi:hypothetical protein